MNPDIIKAIAFDLDGTLINTLPDMLAAANAMRQQLDLPSLPAERISSYIGDGIASLVHRALSDQIDGTVNAADWARGFQAFVSHYRANLCVDSTVYPGVTTALGLLKARQLPLAVITNKSARLATPLLQHLGLADDFSLILGGDSLTEKKPSPLPLLHTCQVFNIAPAELLMVGDSKNDLLAARAAGCPVALVSYGYADVGKLGADLVLDSIEALYTLLQPSASKTRQ